MTLWRDGNLGLGDWGLGVLWNGDFGTGTWGLGD